MAQKYGDWTLKLLRGVVMLAIVLVGQTGAGPLAAENVLAAAERQRRFHLPPTPTWGDLGGWDQPQYFATIRLAGIDGHGRAELLGRGPGGIEVNRFNTAVNAWIAMRPGPPWSDAAHWDQPQSYTTIRFADIDGDGQGELLGRGTDGMEAWQYHPKTDRWIKLGQSGPFADDGADSTNWKLPQHYATIQLADIDGDGRAELIARGTEGIRTYQWNPKTHRWLLRSSGPALSDDSGWDQPEYYTTIQLADIDGLPGAELIARGPDGLRIYRFDQATDRWSPLATITDLSDANGWARPQYFATIHAADIDGRPGAEVIARGPDGLHVYRWNPNSSGWSSLQTIRELSDAGGWDQPQYYLTIQAADIDGSPGAEVIARGREGVLIWRYNQRKDDWTRLRESGAEIPSMSDARGWDRPQYYLTIQAANIDGRPGAEIIGRSTTNITTWRYAGTGLPMTEVIGTPNFPPFPGVQNSYYQYISTNLGEGLDIRSEYDALTSDLIAEKLQTLSTLSPPSGVTPNDPNWLNVVNQIRTELTYVQTANEWILGVRGSQAINDEIFSVIQPDADLVAGYLSNVSDSTEVTANLLSLLSRIAASVLALVGIPNAPAIANLLSIAFAEVAANGNAPNNLQAELAQVKAQLDTISAAAHQAAQDHHDALVTDWSQLAAFAANKMNAPTDPEVDAMNRVGELSYALWLWQTLSPAVWSISLPSLGCGRECFCVNQMDNDYPNPGISYPVNNNSNCGKAWIGALCGVLSCDDPSAQAFKILFGSCATGVDCRDPINGPLIIIGSSGVDDIFLGRNGWSLPCWDQDSDECPLQ
jgi:hypothetical protein